MRGHVTERGSGLSAQRRLAPAHGGMRRSFPVEAMEARSLLSFSPVSDINAQPAPPTLTIVAAEGFAYFPHDDGVHGLELWRSDGTPAGTELVKDVLPGPDGSGPANLGIVGRRLFFKVEDGNGNQQLADVGVSSAIPASAHTDATARRKGPGHREVTVKANANTGLAAPEVFYLGNLTGETGDPESPLRVTTTDLSRMLPALFSEAGVSSPYDHNRDGRVSVHDFAIARAGLGRALGAPGPMSLPMTAPPPAAASLEVQRVWDETEG
jgi:ELWxxDGT repeat protein